MTGSCKFPKIPRIRLSRFAVFLFLLISSAAFSQENCFNGIDDDGDNLVDVFDPDCPCDNQTLLCNPACEFAIPGGPLNFTGRFTSEAEIPNYQTPLIADMDADGVPDIILMSANGFEMSEPRRSKDIIIINGATGATMAIIPTPYMAWVGPNPIAVADVDSDGYGEIIIASVDHADNPAAERRYLFCYEHNGTLKWKSNSQYGYPGTARFGSAVGIADFNHDGIPEVYVYNQIFNALTGRLIISGGNSGGIGKMTSQPFGDLANPVAADITSSPGLELIAGNTVYNIVLTNNGGLPGNSMTPITLAGYPDGFTSVADINLDGKLDVIVAAEGSTGLLYVWNPNEGVPTVISSISLPNTGSNHIGVPFVGDMDKDCAPEIGVTRAQRVFALEYDGSPTLSVKWALTTSDGSGFTGITMFDFNQDGTQELIYRDESTLRIIDGRGSTPVVIGSTPCASGTGSEMAVVADVDGDGQAEICVTCATSNNSIGRINVFETAGQPWAPCRPIWNQFNYFNINVNNNLTIPRQQQQHQVMLSNEACPFYDCSENRPFNSFLTQATLLTQKGCPIYPAGEVGLQIISSQCSGSGTLNLQIVVINNSEVATDVSYPIQFYSGNPLVGAAQRIPSIPGSIATMIGIPPGQAETLAVALDIRNLPKPFNLAVILNDDGTHPAPFAFPVSSLPECNYLNNIQTIEDVNCCSSGDLAISGVVPPNLTFCQGQSGILTAQASSAVGINPSGFLWTLPDNSTSTGSQLLVTTGGLYTITVTDSARCTATTEYTVTAIPLPTVASAGNDQTICSDTTLLSGNIPNVGTGTWTVLEGSGTFDNANSSGAKVSGIGLGTNVYRWAISNGGICVSDDTIRITRVPFPTVSNAGPNLELCIDATVLNANTPVIGTGIWTTISGSGSIADPTNPVSPITSIGIGTNVFQWTITSDHCAPSADRVTIVRHPEPSLANAGSNQSVCATEATLNAAEPEIGTGYWELVSGTGIISDSLSPNPLVTGLGTGENVFRWIVKSGNCAASTDDAVILRTPNPDSADAGIDQRICADFSALGASVPVIGTGVWQLVSGSGQIADTSLANSAITNLGAGANVFSWTVQNGVCPESVDLITVYRDLPPSPADAGIDQRLCANNAVLTATQPGSGTGQWTLVEGSGNIQDSLSASTQISNLLPGLNRFRWTVSSGSCVPSEDEVVLHVDTPVTTPDAGPIIQICQENGTLTGNTPAVGVGVWSVVSGNVLIQDTLDPESAFIMPAAGTAKVRWTITNGTCSAFDETDIVRYSPPTAASAGPDQSICGTTAILAANQPLTGTGTWQVVQGSATFTNPSNPTDQISGLQIGNNILVWTISNGTCPAQRDTVVLVVSTNPVNPDAGTDLSVCADSATLAAVVPSVGIGSWSVIDGSATVVDASLPNSTVRNLSVGVNTFRWTIVNGACEVFDQVTIIRNLPPSIAVAGPDQTLCANSTTLSAIVPEVGIGSWSRISGGGIIQDTLAAETAVNNLSVGDNTFRWTVSSGACPGATDEVTITVNAVPSEANAGADITVCADSVQLAAVAPAIGTGQWQLVSGAGIFFDDSNRNTVVRNLGAGTNTFRWIISNGVCEPDTDEVVITRILSPGIADAGADQQICSDSTTITGNTPATGSGTWTVITGRGTFADANAPSTIVTNIGAGVNVFQWTLSNGVCEPSTDQVIIIRDSIIINANAGPDVNVCASDTAFLTATNAFPATGVWSLVSGSATIHDSTSASTKVSGLAGQNAVFRWTVTTGNCPSRSDEVTVINSQMPSAAFAGNDTSICGTQLQLAATPPAVGSGSWAVVSGTATIDTASQAETEVSGLQPGTNILTWTVNSGSCPAFVDSIVIQVDENPLDPNGGADFSICADTAILSAANPPNGTGSWSLVSGNLTIADTLSPTSAIRDISPGVHILKWTVRSGSCEVSDQVVITRDEFPTIASAGPDQLLCDSVALLTGNLPTIGVGKWTLVNGGGAISNSDSANGVITGVPVGETRLRWTISNGLCASSSDEIVLVRQQSPDIASAGNDFRVCGDSASLQATVPVFARGIWSLVSGAGVIDNANSPFTSITALAAGENVFRWTIADSGSCPGSVDEITVTRDLPPSQPFAGDDFATCSDTISLTANIPDSGQGTWWVISGNGVISDSTSFNPTVSSLTVGQNVFEWRIISGVCPPQSDQITVTRGDTASAGPNQILCDSVGVLEAVAPLTGSGYWQIVSGSGIIVDSTATTTTVEQLGNGANVFKWTLRNAICPDSVAFVTITRKCNEPPVISNESYTIYEDSVLVSNLIGPGEYDPDSTTLISDTIPLAGPQNGTIVIRPDGSFTYTPNPNYNGSDTVVVNICDQGTPLPPICLPDTIFITILPVNDPPVIKNESARTMQDSLLTGNILDNDFDPDSTLLVADTALIKGPSNGIFTIDSSGAYTYLPSPGFTGNDTIIIRVCDQGLPLPPICGFDTLYIAVDDTINEPPIVQNDAFTLLEDESVSGSILPGDYDPEGTTLRADTVPVHMPQHGTITINSDGSFIYTPNPDYYGLDTVVVMVCDSGIPLPPQCVPDTIIFTIQPVNDPPTVANDTAQTEVGTPVSGNILNNDSDKETALLVDTTIVSGPANGTIIILPDGGFTYTPNPGFVGWDTVIVMVCDSGFPLPAICLADTLFIQVTEQVELEASAGPDQVICGFETYLAAMPPQAPVSGHWEIISGGGVLADSTIPAREFPKYPREKLFWFGLSAPGTGKTGTR